MKTLKEKKHFVGVLEKLSAKINNKDTHCISHFKFKNRRMVLACAMTTPFEEMGYTIRATANSYRFVTFLAVQNSSIGDLVTHSLTHSLSH